MDRVVVALITKANDYQLEQAANAEAAARRLGITLDFLWAEGDAITQTRQLITALRAPGAEKPDAVVVEPVGTGMLSVASTAVDHGIGWVVVNRESDYLAPLRQKAKVPVGSIECDNTEVGRIQGRQVSALLPNGGKILYVEGPAADVARQRRAGFDETLAKGIEVETLRGKWTEESGNQVVASRLQWTGNRAPEVALIACQNDAMAMGARKAVEALAKGAHKDAWLALPLTGVDGLPATGQNWVRQGLLAATVVTPPLTGMALEMLKKAAAGDGHIPERTLTRAESFPPIEALRSKAGAKATA